MSGLAASPTPEHAMNSAEQAIAIPRLPSLTKAATLAVFAILTITVCATFGDFGIS
jgi:hypothetical protein